jgi:outer membrane protein TolC
MTRRPTSTLHGHAAVVLAVMLAPVPALLFASSTAHAWTANAQTCSTATPIDGRQPLPIQTAITATVCQRAGQQRRSGLAAQSQAALDRAQGRSLPSLTLDAGAGATTDASASRSITARLSWVLFDFGSASAAVRQGRDALAATLDEQDADVLDAVAEAAQLFAAAQVAQGRYDAAALNLRMTQDSLAAAQARQGAGAASVTEQLQAQTAVSQARLDHARAYHEALIARGALAQAMGLPSGDLQGRLETDDTEAALALQDVDVRTLVEEARERHPRVLAAQARLRENASRQNAIRSERWGTVGLSVNAGRGLNTDSSTRPAAAAALTWSLPLLDRADRESRLLDAMGEARVRESRLDDARRQTETQVWKESHTLIGERRALRESRLVLATAEQALKAAGERFRAGVGGFRDVLSAQGGVIGARVQQIDVEARLRQAQWRLAAATGRLGPLGVGPSGLGSRR